MRKSPIRVAAALAVVGLTTAAGATAARMNEAPPPNDPVIAAVDSGDQPTGPAQRSTNCKKTFSSGSGINLFSYCFSNDGNIVSIENSDGLEHVANGTITEGWCVSSGGVMRGATYGAGANFNLDPPFYPNARKVVHRTSDGVLRVEQTFGQSAGNRIITIIMKVKNTTPNFISDVYVTRFIDADIGNTTGGDVWVSAGRSVAALEPGVARLELIPSTTSETANSMIYSSFFPSLDDLCYDFDADNTTEVLTGSDRSMGVLYQLGTVGPGMTKTVRFAYRISI